MSTRLNRAQPYALGLFRVVIGFLFACHGAAALFGILGGATDGGTVPTGAWPNWYAAVIQLVGGTLVVFGLGTRIAALVCSGSMAYAYFKVHQPDSLFPLQNGGEASAVFCWAFLLLVFSGPGAVAVDRLISARTGGGARGPGQPRAGAGRLGLTARSKHPYCPQPRCPAPRDGGRAGHTRV